jgi:transglutaminase-like putative cysteine protease
MAGILCMEKRFFFPLACGAALGLLIVSGLSCFSCIIYPESTTAQGLPTTESEFKSYITPECPWVQGTLQGILGGSPYEPSQAGFDDIRDWVATNIDYMSDEEEWGVEEYWQTPEETLRLGTGDCEDFAVLLCSLLRVYGIDAEQVYVALSVDDEDGHAFLIEDWYLGGEWRRIESQAPARLSSWRTPFGPYKPHPDSELDKYEITTAFNDLYYYDESFPWD